MTVYTFPASLYTDAVPFASTEETRYYLCGVYIGPHIVATNGHCMIVLDPGDAGPGPGVILGTNKALLAACKPGKRDTRWITIDTTADTARVSVAATAADAAEAPPVCQIGKALIDGTFPEYGRVTPEPTAGKAYVEDGFNPRRLAPFLKLAGDGALQLTAGPDAGCPALVRFSARPDAFGVLMPMRNGAGTDLPAWYRG